MDLWWLTLRKWLGQLANLSSQYYHLHSFLGLILVHFYMILGQSLDLQAISTKFLIFENCRDRLTIMLWPTLTCICRHL